MSLWDEPKDARSESGAGQYPNYNITKTPSGHVIMMDDTKGHESMTIQHRTGTMIQFRPDGTVHIRSNKDKYEVVLGDQKVKITGSHDVSIDGGGSLEVKGNYDMVVRGDMYTTVEGSSKTMVAGDMETVVAGSQVNAVQGDQKVAVNGNQDTYVDGVAMLQGDGGVNIAATNGGLTMGSADNMVMKSDKQLGFQTAGGDMIFKTSGNVLMNEA
jgi:hypothetical protein